MHYGFRGMSHTRVFDGFIKSIGLGAWFCARIWFLRSDNTGRQIFEEIIDWLTVVGFGKRAQYPIHESL